MGLNGVSISALGRAGFKVLVCPCRAKALSLVAGVEPDLVILGERSMADSLEICRQLRQVVAAPVLVIGDIPCAEGWVWANDAGADVYLVRPVRGGELLARIKSVLRRRRRCLEKRIV